MKAATVEIHLAVRPVVEADADFLRAVYASTRADELATVPWEDDVKRSFVDHQFVAQHRDYEARHPHARFLVVLADDIPIGRLYLADLPGPPAEPIELRVLDVALLPQHRGRGFGTALVDYVLRDAARRNLTVTLHVEQWNRARTLYERMGFEVTESVGPSLRMERRPDRPSQVS